MRLNNPPIQTFPNAVPYSRSAQGNQPPDQNMFLQSNQSQAAPAQTVDIPGADLQLFLDALAGLQRSVHAQPRQVNTPSAFEPNPRFPWRRPSRHEQYADILTSPRTDDEVSDSNPNVKQRADVRKRVTNRRYLLNRQKRLQAKHKAQKTNFLA